MKIDLMETQKSNASYPLFGEDGSELGIMTPDHNGYLTAAKSSNWQDAESEALRASIEEAGGTIEQDCEDDGEETFVVRY